MGRRDGALVAATLIAFAGLVVAAPTGATTSSIAVTCVRPNDPSSTPTPRTVAYSVHAPDSVAPGAQYALDTDIGYAVPTDAVGGGIALWQASEGGLSLGGDVTAAAGAPSIHGIVTFPAPNLGGGVVEIGLVGFAVTGARSQPDVTERCTPDAPSVVARIGVGVPLVSIGDAAVVEGSSGTRALEFAVSLSRPAATPVTVAFDTEDGTATAGSDYVAQ